MKLIILDRDGVINHDSPDYIKSPQEWQPIEGSLAAIARLSNAGYQVTIATNQSGIGRSLFDFDALFAMHDKLTRLVAELGGQVHGVFFCPHTPEDGCDCRKPKPGLLQDIGRRFQSDLKAVPVVGDSLRDIQAAQAVSARPILVHTGNGADALRENEALLRDIEQYEDLAAAVDVLLKQASGA